MGGETTGDDGGGPPRRTEPRWPATAALLVAALLFLRLPDTLTPGPGLAFPLVALALAAPLTVVSHLRGRDETRLARRLALALLAVATVAVTGALVLVIDALVGRGSSVDGRALLEASAIVWATNVIVYGVWLWEIDRGGPHRRADEDGGDAPDLLFPQMSDPARFPGWRPAFGDYLFVAFTAATAFSPTDTLPLSQRAKALSAAQAATSFATVVLVTARAVNVLG